MLRNYLHVVHEGDVWKVKREDAQRALSVHATQQEALDAGRQIAQRERAELVIHREDGTIGERSSFGNDPYPPEG